MSDGEGRPGQAEGRWRGEAGAGRGNMEREGQGREGQMLYTTTQKAFLRKSWGKNVCQNLDPLLNSTLG